MLKNYFRDKHGVIHQDEWTPKVYDDEYMSYYEGLRDRTVKLGFQRFGWAMGLFRGLPLRVLEIGYGLGTFLDAARLSGSLRCVGCDVTEYPLPEGCDFMPLDDVVDHRWDVVAMFDVLEHMPDYSFLDRLDAKLVIIAVPYSRWNELWKNHSEEVADHWLENWRMLLPDEHLHHFDPESLEMMMADKGYHLVEINYAENGLRSRDSDKEGNTVFTGVFSKAL